MYKIYTRLGIPPGYAYKILLMMRLTTVLLMATILQVSAGTFAQQISLKERNAPIEKIFDQIRQQSGYDFLFNRDLLKTAKPVSIAVKDASLEHALKICFSEQPFTYTLAEKTIIVKEKEPSFLESLAERWAAIDIRGVVHNEKGEALEGITVAVKGTNRGTTTNAKGEFFLNNVDEKATLVFSGIAIETYEVKINGKKELNVNVRTKQVQLQEVAINTGYQKLSPNQVAGSYEVINNEQLNRRAGPDILSRLEGVTTAVLFDRRYQSPDQNTISPNDISVRGPSTFTSSIKAPLIILNNFPYDGDINNINPNDVENITILKDAAAASIWGARAGNGVIVITTKQGKYNQYTQITVNSNFNIFAKPDLFHYPRMSSADFIDLEKFLFEKGFYNGAIEDTYYKPPLTPVVEILEQQRSGKLSATEANAQIDALRKLDVRNDFNKYIYRTAVNQQYGLNLSGGSEKAKYSFSGGFDRNPASLIGNESQRITLNSNTTLSPVKNLELNIDITYTNSSSKNNSPGAIDGGSYDLNGFAMNRKLYPYAQLADANGSALVLAHDYRTGYIDTAGNGKLLDWKYRPLDELNYADNTGKRQDILLNFTTQYKFTNWFDLQLNYQYEHANGINQRYNDQNTYLTRNQINLFTQIQRDDIKYNLPLGGILFKFNDELNSHKGRAQLNFNREWKDKHQIIGLLGAEISEAQNLSSRNSVFGFNQETLSASLVDEITFFPLYPGTGYNRIPSNHSNSKFTNRFVSFFGNMAYTYANRYTLSASARSDAANLFGVDINNKWKPLWSVGAGWNISNEPFYHLKAAPSLRLRAAYGYQGNVNNSISPYTLISLYETGRNLINEPYAFLNKSGDPSLSWESVRQLNFAIDFSLLENRIAGSFDVYHKKSSNLIFSAPTDITTGVQSVDRNNATMIGKGFDLSLNTVNLNSEFKWQTNLLVAYNTNKVSEYLRDDAGLSIGYIVGHRTSYPLKGFDLNGIYSLPFKGLDPNNGNPIGVLNKQTSMDYRAIFQQTIDNNPDFVYHGSALPRYSGNLNNTFSYKGLSMLINLSYRFGYYFFKNSISYQDLVNQGVMHRDYEKRWQGSGDEKITNIPSMIFPANDPSRDTFYSLSSVNVLPGDHIRLKSIRLSYALANRQLNGLGMKSFEFYSMVDNIGILWRANKQGLDPDYDLGNAYFPPLRNITIGAKFGF
uniref:SusC/RagA family TonB-linked outer membrane protein n=1 Tax=Pedobacter schmidteae TaxID=2201271 RepID=UPI000EB5BFE7|nr:SusC/RagA family TonB-linked outer membrane protein [Pedobacter schmidteae]